MPLGVVELLEDGEPGEAKPRDHEMVMMIMMVMARVMARVRVEADVVVQ